MCLIAEVSAFASTLQMAGNIVLVALGLGAVIFVHELGHFMVAKMCGVKCDKFFIGFDIGGYKISRQWGETEYGIGILPLGGYVKMLGQDDNPANAAKERERTLVAKAQQEEQAEDGADSGDSSAEDSAATASSQDYELDPRSYSAKSVPKRMAIISAGVVMNVIFAFVFATIAYMQGVTYTTCDISAVVPGSPAYVEDMSTGGKIAVLNGDTTPRFRDLMEEVSLSKTGEPINIMYRLPGSTETRKIDIVAKRKGEDLKKIGLLPGRSLDLPKEMPVQPGTPAAAADPPFEGGDQIIAVDGTPVTTYQQLTDALTRDPGKPMKITVRRGGKLPKNGSTAPMTGGKTIDIAVGVRKMKRIGLVMHLGSIAAVQKGSPAEEKGIRPNDLIKAFDGGNINDPLIWPEFLRRKATSGSELISLSIQPHDESSTIKQGESFTINLRDEPRYEPSFTPGSPISVPALGLCYHLVNRVEKVIPGSPAEKAGLLPSHSIEMAEFVLKDPDADLPEDEYLKAMIKEYLKAEIKFGDDQHNWPFFMYQLQGLPDQMQVKLTVKDLSEPVLLTPEEDPNWYNPERGMVYYGIRDVRVATSFTDAMRLGYNETVDSLLLVFRFLRSLLSGEVSPLHLGGPGTIGMGAFYAASRSISALLIFLTVISANLAIVNFLPIPVLDGGHMVFLIYEGVMRKPAPEKFVGLLTVAGLMLILSLMVFVLALDFGMISRPS